MTKMEASSFTVGPLASAAPLCAYGGDVLQALQALRDDDWEVRAAAAVELESIGAGAARAVPALIRVLESDKTEEVRRAAAEALGSIGPAAKEAIPVLARMLSDDDVYMRWAATKALKAITARG
jgi:HEAT repeat protein